MKKIIILTSLLFLIVGIVACARLFIIDKADVFDSSLEALRSLPYLSLSSQVANDGHQGVVKNISSASWAGYNLYADYDKNIYLIDMI